jgi:fluoride exporter
LCGCQTQQAGIHGRFRKGSIDGYALKLGVSSLEAWVLVGVLLLLLALLLVGLLVAVSRRWKTGVFADPWVRPSPLSVLDQVADAVCV